MPPLEPFAILLGQLLAVAFACGLNLYGTLLLLGLAARLGWFGGLPMEIRGLENGLVVGLAGVLFVVEFVVDKIPQVDSAWDAVHTVVRPAAAALLAALALQGLGWPWALGGAAVAGVTALAAHGSKAGLRLILNAQPWRGRNVLLSLAEDVLALALAAAALIWPAAAIAVAGGALLLVLLVGPRFWRAAVLGLRGLNARVRGFFGQAEWRAPADMPRPLRRLVRESALGSGAPRAVRAAVKGLGGVGAYRNGWLVIEPDARAFLYRSWRGVRRAEVPPATEVRVRAGVWADILELEGPAGSCLIFVLKDGPDPALAAAELRQAEG